MPARPPRWFMRFQWRSHKALWRWSGGRLGRRIGGLPVLELVTTGHRSGEPRTILIWYVDDEGGPIIAGTNAGADRDPAWVRNLRADSAARLRADGAWRTVEAHFLKGPEYQAAWDRFLAASDDYANYATLLTRPIPLVQLVDTTR